ncbi:MAG: hypothetical protein ABI658_02250 [Acidimicrobiales bacterium]
MDSLEVTPQPTPRAPHTLLATATKERTPLLGEMLLEFRTSAAESATTVSRRSGLGAVDIARFEHGRADLSADQLAGAVDAYSVPRVILPEGRCRVKVDLVGGLVSVQVADEIVEESPADRILLVYLELIFAAGDLPPTTAIPFTELDLDVLRTVLSSRTDAVTKHLDSIVGPIEEFSIQAMPSVQLISSVHPRSSVRSAVLVLAASVTALAAVIAVHDSVSSRQTVVAPIETQIIDAVVLTR